MKIPRPSARRRSYSRNDENRPDISDRRKPKSHAFRYQHRPPSPAETALRSARQRRDRAHAGGRVAPCAEDPSRSLAYPGSLVGIEPPQRRQTGTAVFRQRLGMAEAIPARVARKAISELRHDVEIPQQHAIERPRGGLQVRTILGEDHLLDQPIHSRIPDADGVSRTGLIGGLRSPEFALLVAGRQRLCPLVDDNIKIEAAQPVLVLRIVDNADRCGDADAFQRRLVEQRDPLRGWILNQYLGGDRLTRGIHQFALAYLEARLFQQPRALPQIGAYRLGIAADRIGIGRREDFNRHLVAHRLENLQLLSFWQSGRRKLRSLA